MSWVPKDLVTLCKVHTTVTSCSPSSILFLQMIVSMFSWSRDSKDNTFISPFGTYNYNGFVREFHTGFNEENTDKNNYDFIVVGAGSAGCVVANRLSEISEWNLVTRLLGWSRDAQNNFFDQAFNGRGTDAYGSISSNIGFDSGFANSHSEFVKTTLERDYDFIVIGGGSAGCVVANRLTEIPDWRVLLLEAGDEEPEVAEVPAFAPLLMRSSIDWAYMTQPSPNSCRARQDGRCLWSRGRVMGGSSTINYMIYTRGNQLDYDEWAALGNPGWSYKDVLPYFRKSEDNRNPERIEQYYHGFGGYQTVEIFPYQDRNQFTIIEGFKELGLPEIDQNAEEQIGVMLLQHTTRNGERLSTNGAFIRPIRNKRPNLTVMPNTRVARILIDPKKKTAFGVEVLRAGKIQKIYAKKEVILSAGSIDSPRILMVSGIGLESDLRKHGIEPIQNLPVGYNLQDHTTIDGVMVAFNNKSSTTPTDEQRNQDVYTWQETRNGPLAATGNLQVNTFVQTKYADPHRPDIQYSLDSVSVSNFLTDPILTAQTNINPLAYYDGMMIRPILLGPLSRGYVELNDTDPVFGDPLIHANTFTVERDLEVMVEGIKQSLNLLNTHALQKLGAQLVDVPWPACRHLQFGTDQYWACIAMSYTTTIFHPVGTCKMGPKNDKTSVVDSKLRVHGIKKLRVIDSSIMPIIMRGNTNAPTIMIAEKGSDYIKDLWLKHGDYFEHNRYYDVTEKDNFDFYK